MGEHYSEYALRNRINAKKKYELEIEKKINSAKKESPEIIVLKTIRFYTVAFSKGALLVKRREKNKPFSWTNNSELDKIIVLNNKINSGATLETLRKDFENAENAVAEKEKILDKAKSNLKTFYELKEKLEIVFENKKSGVFSIAEKVFGGTYVQSLVAEERECNESKFMSICLFFRKVLSIW